MISLHLFIMWKVCDFCLYWGFCHSSLAT